MAIPSHPWFVRRVFVSSTFKDMHAERDRLAHDSFLRLADLLRQRRHEFRGIDLRQGVPSADIADEGEREMRVLQVCLQAIEESRPFMIVLLGERFGYVPASERMQAVARETRFESDVSGMSVTALEVEFGLFQKNPDARRRAFIYLRDPVDWTGKPETLAAQHSDAHSPTPVVRAEGPRRLAALKARIAADPELKARTRRYRATWLETPGDFSGLDALAEQVFADLWGELETETAAFASQRTNTEEESEALALGDFVRERCQGFTGRAALTKDFLDAARSRESPPPGTVAGAIATGEPGAGKSAFWANLYQHLQDDARVFLLANAAGGTPRGEDARWMLRRFVVELATHLSIPCPLEESASETDTHNAFYALLGRAAENQRVVLLLDALDQFGDYLGWIEPARWPANARLIATAQSQCEAVQLLARAGVGQHDMPPLADADMDAIAAVVYRRYGREPDAMTVAALKHRQTDDGRPSACNPLWLTLALDQLNLLSGDGYARADHEFAHLPAHERLRALLMATIAAMRSDVPGLCHWLLESAEHHYGKVNARGFAVAIALSRSGWRDVDLADLTPRLGRMLVERTDPNGPYESQPLPEQTLALLRLGFRAYVVRRGLLGKITFAHVQLQRAVLDRLAVEDVERTSLHAAVSDYLKTLPRGDPIAIWEQARQLIAARNGARMAKYISSVNMPVPDLDSDAMEERAAAAIAVHDLLASPVSDADRAAVYGCVTTWLGSEELTVIDRLIIIEFLHDLLRLDYSEDNRIALARQLVAALRRLQQEFDNEIPKNMLVSSYLALADALCGSGVPREGIGYLYEAIEIARSTSPGYSGNVEAMNAGNRLGQVLLSRGEYADALDVFQTSLSNDVVGSLGEHDASANRLMATMQSGVGKCLAGLGNAEDALGAFHRARESLERSAALDGDDLGLNANLVLLLIDAGDTVARAGNRRKAIDLFRVALHGASQLAEVDHPGTDRFKDAEETLGQRIGDLELAEGNAAAAVVSLQASYELACERLRRSIASRAGQHNLLLAAGRLGDALLAAGKENEAQEKYSEALQLGVRLVESDPGNYEWLRDLATTHFKIAQAATSLADMIDHQCDCEEILDGMTSAGMELDPDVERLRRRLKTPPNER